MAVERKGGWNPNDHAGTDTSNRSSGAGCEANQ